MSDYISPYLSGRQKNLKIGVSSYTDNTTVLQVIGNVEVSGILTANSYYIGTSQVIGSGRQLQNIASLDAITTQTIEEAIKVAPNDFNNLNVSGISTLQSTTLIGGGVNPYPLPFEIISNPITDPLEILATALALTPQGVSGGEIVTVGVDV